MTLRRRAPSSFKPLTTVAFLSLFSLLLAGLMVHLPSLAHAELPLPVKFATPSFMPPNLPDGWDYGTVSVRPIAGKQLRLSLKHVLAFDQTAAPTAASNLADVPAATDTEMPPATGVAEPQETSIGEILAAPSTTPTSQTRQIGMFVLLFTTLSAVTLLLWRHYRRDDASPRRIGRRI